MLRGMIFLVNGFGGIGEVLSQWEQAGIFTYVIPFLLIFALVFGILTQTGLFKEKKAINAIIALAVSLMALQFAFVSTFFSEIFPRLGIGLVVLLVVMVLLGLFAPNRTWVTYTLFGAAAVILIVVLANTATAVQWFSSGFLSKINWQLLLPLIIIVVVIAVIVAASAKPKEKQDVSSNFMRALFSGKGE